MQDPSAETTELRKGTVESLAPGINRIPSLVERKSNRTLRWRSLPFTTLCVTHRHGGIAVVTFTNAQPRFTFNGDTQCPSRRVTSGLHVKPALGREDGSVCRFASSLSAAQQVPGPCCSRLAHPTATGTRNGIAVVVWS
jgi:hypothetical protein